MSPCHLSHSSMCLCNSSCNSAKHAPPAWSLPLIHNKRVVLHSLCLHCGHPPRKGCDQTCRAILHCRTGSSRFQVHGRRTRGSKSPQPKEKLNLRSDHPQLAFATDQGEALRGFDSFTISMRPPTRAAGCQARTLCHRSTAPTGRNFVVRADAIDYSRHEKPDRTPHGTQDRVSQTSGCARTSRSKGISVRTTNSMC